MKYDLDPPPPARRSFEDLYNEYARQVYRFTFALLRSQSEAEDATAETFVKAFAAYERLTAGGERAWLFQIAYNTSVTQHRKAARKRKLLALLGRARPPEDDPERLVELNAGLAELLGAMHRLNRRDRKIVLLRYYADLPFAEIGKLVGMSEASAGVTCRRAVERLRDIVRVDR
jgi:RNA polymerase sigma-70 factor (ECF subfamily)